MKANEMQREELSAFVESDAGRDLMERLDAGWDEVMATARAYGLIVQAYGGTATLCTYGSMMEEVGTIGVVRMLQMNGIEVQ